MARGTLYFDAFWQERMAWNNFAILLASAFIIIIPTLLNNAYASSCYKSIFGFGDSIMDTGNLLFLTPPNVTWELSRPPYGETFFHYPTGRCSDGRIVIDFLAEYFGLPLAPPSVAVSNGTAKGDAGANMAVVGSMTLDVDYYAKFRVYDATTNITLIDQMNQFKQLLPSFCGTPSSCSRKLQKSLIILGPWGGNDYARSYLAGKSLSFMRPRTPLIAKAIASAVNELVELGAKTIVVPGLLPNGCSAGFLTLLESTKPEDYDELGCLIWLNNFVMYHNEFVQRELQQCREIHPDANIIYADFYNPLMEIYRNPTKYGFKEPIKACCGTGGGKYNYRPETSCGNPPAKSCEDPSSYVNWDGYHLTEAGYRLIAKAWLEGPYTIPHLKTHCVDMTTESGFVEDE